MREDKTREGRLADAFVTVADSLVTGYDVVDLVHGLIDYCVDLLDEVSAAGLVLRDPFGALEVLASTREDTRLLELMQVRDEAGPCVECYRTGQVVTADDLSDDLSHDAGRWPTFRVAALAEGFRSVHSVPMRLRADTIGAMNLFSAGTGPLPAADARVVRALTDVATIAILQERALRQSTIVREQLQGALNSRVVIEQAKGVLAHQASVDMDTAFRLLRSYARNRNEHLSDVAVAVINGRLNAATLDRGSGATIARHREPS